MIFYDQLNTKVTLNNYPKRIISLVPSQSELLWDLGLRNEIVGITKFCIHPTELYKTITRVGGTKTFDIEKIRNLEPDLIIGNKEENEQIKIELLQKEFSVWISDIYNLDDSLAMINMVGDVVNKKTVAQKLSTEIKSSFDNLKQLNKKVLYLIWKNPYMGVGKATFIGDMLTKCGFENGLKDETLRYPELTFDTIKEINPDVIFLSTEPYSFKEQHVLEFQNEFPRAQVKLVDGELFSWYGSRLKYSADYFNTILNSLTF